MELIPKLDFGWLNGWILLVIEFSIQGFLLLVFPKDVVSRLFNRSGWNTKQKVFTVAGKVSSLVCLILIIFTPLKTDVGILIIGLLLYVLGLTGLVVAMLNFKDTPLDQPVTKGIYKISRHPQIVSLFFIFLGICIAIGSWAAVFALLLSKLLQHFGILAEEEICLQQFGESYRSYMKEIPRYFLFF